MRAEYAMVAMEGAVARELGGIRSNGECHVQ